MTNSKPIIEAWFPKTLYVVNEFHLDNLELYKKELLKLIAKQSIRNGSNFVDTTHNVGESDLTNNPIFANLINDLLFYCNDYANTLGYRLNLKIENMWANLSKKNDYLFPHIHSGSLLSGVFYISVDNENETIKFYDNINNMMVSPPSENLSEISFETCEHSCKPGKLILFKSNFLHGCPALIGNEKIVISFNVNYDS